MAKLYIIKSLIKEKLKKIDIIIEDWKNDYIFFEYFIHNIDIDIFISFINNDIFNFTNNLFVNRLKFYFSHKYVFGFLS